MFSDKKDKSNMEPAASQNRINEGTKLKGDIHSTGFFRIDGTVEGNISTPSKIVIGKTGVVVGTLHCENADIEGKFEGKLDISGTLSLKSSAHIEGDVVVGKLAVEPGATFNASCAMQGAAKSKKGLPTSQSENQSLKSQNHPFDRTQRTQKSKAEQQG